MEDVRTTFRAIEVLGYVKTAASPDGKENTAHKRNLLVGTLKKKNKLNITACSIRYIKFDSEVAKG